MLQVHFFVEVTVFSIFLCFTLEYRPIFRIQRLQQLPLNFYGFHNVTHRENPCHSAIPGDSNDIHPAFCNSLLSWGTLQNAFGNDRPRDSPRPFQHDPGGKSAEPSLKKMNGQQGQCGPLAFCAEEGPVRSVASAAGPWGQSLYASISHLANIMQHRARSRRRSLTRYITGYTLPQVQSAAQPSAFGLKFHKCAQVEVGTEFPHLTFFLLIHNIGPPGGTNLSQLAIRDSVSGIAPLQSVGMVVEKGFQTFTIDSLPAGSQYVVTYTALIKGHKSEILDLPAFLTFSNASLNDVNMFGPVVANLTLRVNSTDKIHPNHGVHFAGFVGGFFLSLLLLSLGFLAMNLICARARKTSLQRRKKRGDSDPEYAVCNMSETAKEEAAFEDKMVDIMVLEDPQNMYQALENLEMSSLLRATSSLESSRVQMYKDVIAALLAALCSQNHMSQQAEQRLLSVLHGQLMGMEGKLKEEHVARMATLAAQCNLETREQMEAEHRREAQEKARAEVLFQHAGQQELLQCGVLLEKLHKLNQSQLQRTLLARHEEASAKVQRHIVEWRKVELHQIFSEELEEATRMGELEKTVARSLLHDYFTYQNQLEEVLDVVLANQRCMLGERHAQRRFLVHSLHSLKGLISETFSKTSSQIESCFNQHRRGSDVSGEQVELLLDKAQKQLVLVKQGLDEALNRERRAMHCGLVKKRRDLISDMLQGHKQRQKELSSLSRGGLEEDRVEVKPSQHLHCWQNLLTSQCLELGELINNLDEEAAADIRKVTMRVIHSPMAEVKAIQPAAAQALLALGTPRGPFQQPEQGAHTGASSSNLSQAQERLHLDGKAAVRTLQASRDSLHQGMGRELQEQQELRAKGRAFYRSLCSSQLTLSDEELLRMKLEFQNCLFRMDHCLVLPHALSRSKLQTALSTWRKEMGEQAEHPQPTEKKTRTKGKFTEARQRADPSELLLFQKKMEDRIQLFEKEKEKESTAMEKVLEEMRSEREVELQHQADGLAVQMAALHYQKVERRTRVLESSRALLSIQSLLTEELRASRSLGAAPIAQSIQNHCLGLEEAELQLQREHAELESLETGPTRLTQNRPPKDPDHSDHEEEEGDEEEGRLFHIECDSRMATILHEALYKCDQVTGLQTERLQEANARSQAMEDLKEQLELKRLYTNCDQDLEFAARLVRQSQVSAEVLLEALRLLLPTLPESELLSLINALCPKQPVLPASAEQESIGWPGGAGKSLLVRLREDMVGRNFSAHTTDQDRNQFQEKRQSLLERLFLNPRPEAPRDVMQVLVQEKGREGVLRPTPQQPTPKPVATGTSQTTTSEQLQDSVLISVGGGVEVDSETVFDSTTVTKTSTSCPANDAVVQDIPTTGERVFVFRAPLEPQNTTAATNRKRKKRNFLNLKKGSVAPTDQP
ncbi:limbin isoform X2 [Coregonus clupeaformis]|uniref:limbin isoform X2 n=1 Tax=Coregonus clupeaformis TaxID=59861 RepID=UPI001E1C55C2|nr:limbin isoform X2 [Coregonus clupeaformis]